MDKDIEEILNEYVKDKGYQLTSIQEQRDKILNLLRDKKEKLGKFYCPCRMFTGMPEYDDKIVCPCEFHAKEIEENGICHCNLIIKKD